MNLNNNDVKNKVNKYTKIISKCLNLFYPKQDGSLVYVSCHYETILCHLLNHVSDTNEDISRCMNFNRPSPEVYFLYENSLDIPEEESIKLENELYEAPFPVVLDSQVVGAHHKSWSGHIISDQQCLPLDTKCRDAFGVFPTLASSLESWPEEVILDLSLKIKHKFTDEIFNKLISTPCYKTYKSGETFLRFPYAEDYLLDLLPSAFKECYLLLHFFFSTKFHQDFPDMCWILIHSVLWTHHNLCVESEEHSDEISTRRIVSHILTKILGKSTVKDYFVKEQVKTNEVQSLLMEITTDDVMSDELSFLKIEGSFLEDFESFLLDRICSTVKLQLLRLRRHTCDYLNFDTKKLDEYLALYESNLKQYEPLKRIVNSWKLGIEMSKYLSIKKRKEQSILQDILDSHSSNLCPITRSLAYYKLNDFAKAIETIQPLVSKWFAKSPFSTEASNVDFSLRTDDSAFLEDALRIQSLSLVMIGENEIPLYDEFLKWEEVRLARSPLAGDMPDSMTGVFSFHVFVGCLYALYLWNLHKENYDQVEDKNSRKDQATEMLNYLTKLIETLAEDPWDGNDKRYCSHMNMVGHCYIIMDNLPGALEAFRHSDKSFPIRFSTAGSMTRKIQKQLDQKQNGLSKAWIVAGVCGAAAVVFGFARFISK